MVAPLIATGARTAAAQVAKRDARKKSTQRGIRAAVVVNKDLTPEWNNYADKLTSDPRYSAIRNAQIHPKKTSQPSLEGQHQRKPTHNNVPHYQGQKRLQGEKKSDSTGVRKNFHQKMKTAGVATSTLMPGLYVHIGLLFFWLIAMVGMGLAFLGEEAFNWIPIFGDNVASLARKPGEYIFSFGWIMTTVIGCTTMAVILIWFFFRGVWWFKNTIILLLAIVAFTLYIVPVTSFFPWFIPFVLGVVLLYK